MKQNVFYLDESGDFTLDEKKRNIVGGAFSNRELSISEVQDFFRKLGYESFRSANINDKAVEFSRVLDGIITFCNDKDICPVLFISPKDFFIVDDSKTYLNIVSDGMVAWLRKNSLLVETLPGIHLVIEKRSTSKNKLEGNLRERLSLVGYKNLRLKNTPCVTLELGSKETPQLWLADGIVHGYNVRDKLARTVRQKFEKWIHGHAILLYQEEGQKRIVDYFNDENVVQGLTRLTMAYNNDYETFHQLATEQFKILSRYPVDTISAIIEQLIAFFMDRVNTSREMDTVEYVNTWIRTLLPLLQEKIGNTGLADPSDLNWCYLRFYEILVNAYNHSGAVQKAEQSFAEVDGKVKTLQLDLSTYQSWARLQVLRGVHLTNMYCYDETIRLMERLNDTIGEALTFLDDPEKNITVKPSIVGEIKGTMLQAMMYRSAETKEGWENIRKLSDDLFETFPLQQDRNRQLQYRSQLEAYADEMDKAREYLAKAMGMGYDNDEALCGKVLERGNSFELLHFLRIWYMEIARGRVPGQEL